MVAMGITEKDTFSYHRSCYIEDKILRQNRKSYTFDLSLLKLS